MWFLVFFWDQNYSTVVCLHMDSALNYQCPKTYPIGSAGSLEINTVAFMREERSIPKAAVRLVVTNCKRLSNLNIVGWKLCCKIILRVQEWCVLEVNWYWVAFQDFSCFFGSTGTLFFNNYLVDTKKKQERGRWRKMAWEKILGYIQEPDQNLFVI